MRIFLVELLNRTDHASRSRNLITGMLISVTIYVTFRMAFFIGDHYQEAFLWLIYLLIK